MRNFLVVLTSVLATLSPSLSHAQELPPIEIYQQMLEANKPTGWVAFREYNGQQWIYFTTLITLHCRLEEIKYSINSDALDQSFPLPRCNPSLPFSMPNDVGPDDIAIALPLGSADTISIQVSFTGGKKLSDIVTYRPCKDAGEASCAVMVE